MPLGRVTGMLSLAADITEMRQLEVQYRQAQKMEAVGRLAGGIAHDFNNLLTAIIGTTALVLEDLGLESRTRLDIQEIEKAAKRAAGLTRQLLIFSRQQVLEPRALDLNALVGNLEKMLHRLIGEDIELRTRQAAALGAVRADPGQIEQAIVNLVVNARDAMPQGGRLTIETAEVELDRATLQGMYQPSRADTCCSLSATRVWAWMARPKARLFEPFFTTKEPGRGTGLGLATVYGIVKQSGGYVWAYSELGHGTTFKIYLPRVAKTPEAPESTTGTPTPARGSETVLVVEDQEEVRKLTKRVLQGRGYTVLTARHGAEALEIVAQHPTQIHLMVTRCGDARDERPRAGAARLREAERPESALCVGYTGEAVLQHRLLEPGVAFLQKPFTPDVLARKTREVLDNSRAT